MNKIKLCSILVLFAISIFAVSSIVSADVTIKEVYADGNELSDQINDLGIQKDNQIEVKVIATNDGNGTVDNVKIRAILSGGQDDVYDVTDKFNMRPGVSYSKKLNLNIPLRMEQDTYTLMIYVDNADGVLFESHKYKLDIQADEHKLQIKDIILSPESSVGAGRALLVSARVKNRGLHKEQDVKVKASIAKLGVSASAYISELDPEGGDDDSATSEELYMRIPDNAKSGQYDVTVEVEYNDGDDKETATATISVEGAEEQAVPQVEDKKVSKIVAGPEVQDISIGEGKNYLVTISNEGSTAKTYTLDVTGSAWADATISPSATDVIQGGASKTFSVFITPKSIAAVGENIFTVTVNVDGTSQEIPLKANVLAGKTTTSTVSLKKALEIVLIILVVLLVIIGLIIGFSKLRRKEESEEDKSSETYY